MGGGLQPHGGKPLRRYELGNLLFFLTVIVGLVLFVSFVFRSYRTKGGIFVRESSQEPGILSEKITPESYACVYYLGTRISETSRTYRSRADIPVLDDGMLKSLFYIEGVEEVVVDRKMVIITKSSSASWERIQPRVREVLNAHLHMHAQ